MDGRLASFILLFIAGFVRAQDPPTCTVAGERFPDSVDCNAFWMCNTDLVPSKYECAAGQYWDTTANACNPVEQVDCGTRSTVIFTDAPTSTAAGTTSTNAPSTTSPGQIVCTYSGELFTYQGNCQQFWFCNTDLVPYLYTCANGEYWDDTLKSCNPAVTVDCGDRPTPAATPTPTAAPATTSPGQIVCAYAGELFTYQGNCQEFWFCNTELVPYVYQCANGEYWDATLNSCNPEGTVDCGDRPTPSSSTGTTSPTVATPSPGQVCEYVSQLLPNCNDCGSFFECDALLNPVYEACPAGESFSIADNDCQEAGNVDCTAGARPDYDLCPSTL